MIIFAIALPVIAVSVWIHAYKQFKKTENEIFYQEPS